MLPFEVTDESARHLLKETRCQVDAWRSQGNRKVLSQMSFPRRRESRTVSNQCLLDPHFHGDDFLTTLRPPWWRSSTYHGPAMNCDPRYYPEILQVVPGSGYEIFLYFKRVGSLLSRWSARSTKLSQVDRLWSAYGLRRRGCFAGGGLGIG